MAATEPSRSPMTCTNAARVLTFSRSRDRLHATAMLTSKPMPAMSEHAEALHRHRMIEAVDGFVEDPRHDGQHRDRVDEGGDHLDARQAEGVPVRDRPARDEVGREREQQRRRVGRHVPGIGQQRQRPGPQSADHLDHRVAQRQPDGDGERTRAVRGATGGCSGCRRVRAASSGEWPACPALMRGLAVPTLRPSPRAAKDGRGSRS